MSIAERPDTRQKRLRTPLRAFAYHNGHGHPCLVVDIAADGCTIELARMVALPERIELEIVGKPIARHAWVHEQSGRIVTLSFTQPPTRIVEL